MREYGKDSRMGIMLASLHKFGMLFCDVDSVRPHVTSL